MATYKQIFGKQVKFLSSDPANEATGQIWFNSTSNTFKTVVSSGAWSSGSGTVNGLMQRGQGTGIQTAALAAGGNPGSAPYPLQNSTEEYNGSGWASGGNLNTAGASASQANNGTQTAALIWGRYVGSPSTATEEYDGTSWTTSPGSRSVGNYRGAGAGTQTAALATGGYPPSSTAVEEYDGSTWTAGTVLPAGRQDSSGAGTQTAGIVMGGDTGPPTTLDLVQTYDGSSWTTVTAMPTERQEQGGVGLQTAALVFGGLTGPGAGTPASTTSVSYDGSAWTAGGSLATGRQEGTNAGTSTSALFGGGTSTVASVTVTEEYNVAATVITGAAWASAPALSTGRYSCAGTGTITAAMLTGGTIAPGGYTNATEEYDGSSWTGGGVYPAIIQGGGSTGPQTAALYTGGYVSGPGIQNQTATYNGTAWTIVPGTLNNARGQSMNGCVGTTSAAMLAGGDDDGTLPYFSATETYDGSTWTTSPGTLSSARTGISVVGTSTVAVTAGGGDAPGAPGNTNIIQTWNGSAWATSPATLNTNRIFFFRAGASSTSALFIGGDTPGGKTTQTESWNGTVAITDASLSTATAEGGSAGPSTSAALIFGGITPLSGNSGVTQEYTGATTAANYKTLTTS